MANANKNSAWKAAVGEHPSDSARVLATASSSRSQKPNITVRSVDRVNSHFRGHIGNEVVIESSGPYSSYADSSFKIGVQYPYGKIVHPRMTQPAIISQINTYFQKNRLNVSCNNEVLENGAVLTRYQVKDNNGELYFASNLVGQNKKDNMQVIWQQIYNHIRERTDSCNTMKSRTVSPRSSRTFVNSSYVHPPTEVGKDQESPVTQVDNTRETAELNRDMRTDEAANVQLAETTEPSASKVAIALTNDRHFINDLPVTLSSLGDRWARFAQFEWSSGDDFGAILARYDLPLTLLQNARCSPNTLLFDQYAFFKTDMRLKIQVNTSPGMSGMLIAGVMYNASELTAAGSRISHSAQFVQMPHVRLNAASSNSGELHVPWVFNVPVVPTRNMTYCRGSYYFTLFFGVLGQLRSGLTGATTANVTVYGKFENLQFYGQRDYRAVVARSSGGLLNTAIGALTGGGDISQIERLLSHLDLPDCDRPQNPREPMPVYQQQNTSLSLGTGTNVVKLLQLLHDNTCPHPKDLVPADEQFTSKFIQSQWGVVANFQWNTTLGVNGLLFTLPVTPMQFLSVGNESLPTPLSGLGNYFGGYHGDIEFRFTFFVSKFHSGRVSIVYVPDTVTNLTSSACYYSTIVDVQDQSELVFTAPYQVPTLYAPTRTQIREWDFVRTEIPSGSVTYPNYGVILVNVVNPLRANQTAAQAIQVLVESRGADNFNYVLPIGTNQPIRSTSTPGRQVVARSEPDARATAVSSDERTKVITGRAPLTMPVPTWFSSMNERYEVRDVAKRYVPIFTTQSSGLNEASIVDATAFNYALLSVYYCPVTELGGTPILNPQWRQLPGVTAFGRSYMVAHERINLNRNTSISFRVPWNSPMAMLANGIDPTLSNNTMQSYCNGRVTVVLTVNGVEFGETATKPLNAAFQFDVTAGTVRVQDATEESNYNLVDFVSYMHEGFRFFRGDLNYQIDILPYRRQNGWDFETVIHRALGDTANFYVFQGFPFNTQSKAYVNQLASTQQPAVGSIRQLSATAWVRDLTEEGVEPNPGPIFSKFNCAETGETVVNGVESCLTKVADALSIDLDFIKEQVPRLCRLAMVGAVSYLSPTIAVAMFAEFVYSDLRGKLLEAGSKATYKAVIEEKKEQIVESAMQLTRVAAMAMNVYYSQTQLQVCLNVAAFFCEFKLIKSFSNKIYKMFTNDDGLMARSTSNLGNAWATMFISGALAALGITTKGFTSASFLNGCTDFFRNGVNVRRFLDMHIDLFSEIMRWVKNRFGYETFDETIPADVLAWMQSVNHYCEMYNADSILTDERVIREIFRLRAESNRFDMLFVETNVKSPPGYYHYKNKLNRVVDMLAQGGLTESVRPTPFCVWLYGDPGVGKSRVADEVLINIGKTLRIVSSSPVYSRTPGTKHWNNYQQQPLILIPDFGTNQSSQQYVEDIHEFMSLIDVWPYNPMFAELSDKRRLVKADGVVVCSNFAFPNLTSVGHVNTTAFYRRRHALVHVYIPKEVQEDVLHVHKIDITETIAQKEHYMASKIPKEWFEANGTYAHLRFQLHATGNAEAPEPTIYDYASFTRLISKQVGEHRAKEVAFCEKTRDLYSTLRPENIEEGVNGVYRQYVGRSDRPQCSSDFRLGHILDDVGDLGLGSVSRIVWVSELDATVIGYKALECGCRYAFSNGALTYSRLCSMPDFDHTRHGEPVARDSGWLRGSTGPGRPSVPVRYHCLSEIIPKGSDYGYRPGQVVEWSDKIWQCPHNEVILSNAFFVEYKGRVELAVMSSDSVTFVLPPRCVNNRLRWSRNIFTGWHAEMPYRPEDWHAEGAVPMGFNRDAEGKHVPFLCPMHSGRVAFVVDKNVLRFAVRGTVVAVEDVATQVEMLNQILTGTFPDGDMRTGNYDVCMTFLKFRKDEFTTYKVMKESVKKWWASALMLLCVINTTYQIFKLVRAVYRQWKSSSVEAQGNYDAGGSAQRTKNEATELPRSQVTARGQQEIVFEMLRKNTVTLHKGGFSLEGLRICSVYVLCPAHLFEHEGPLAITIYGKRHEIEDKACTVAFYDVKGQQSDMCIVKIPILPASRNILGHFITERESNALKSASCVYGLQADEFKNFPIDIEIVPEERQAYLNMNKSFTLSGYKWIGDTTGYRCGAMLVSNSRLVGMYVADVRSERLGFAVGVTRESIVAGLESLGATHYDMKLHRYAREKSGESFVPSDANMIPLSVIDNPISYPGKTSLEVSDVTARVSGPYLFPAEQRGNMAVPGLEPVFKYARKQVKPREMAHNIMTVVTAFFVHKISNLPRPLLTNRPFTVEQAICGLEGDVRFPSMNLNSALGWPFRDLVPKGKKKKHYIDKDLRTMHVLLRDHYVKNHDDRMHGIIPDVAFMDFPKDETLKPGKDTRLINGSPICHFIDMRRYLWQFFQAVCGKPTGIMVGLDVHSDEWGEIMHICPDPIDEDYKAFGYTWHSQIMDVIKQAALKWIEQNMDYTEEEKLLVVTMFEEMKNSTHVLYDLKYHVLCGSPSGAFGTDRLNSLANLYYQMYDHFLQFGNFDKWDDEIILIYGDDLRRNKLRSSASFIKNMSSIGMIVEADKTGKTFLKRRVNLQQLDDGFICLAPLPPHVLVDMLHWVRRPYFSKQEAMKQRFEAFLQELSHYGKTTYDKAVPRIREIAPTGLDIPEFDIVIKDRYKNRLSEAQLSNLRLLDCKMSHVDVSHYIFGETHKDKDEFDTKVLGCANEWNAE